MTNQPVNRNRATLLGGPIVVFAILLALLRVGAYAPRIARAEEPTPPTIIITNDTTSDTFIAHRAMGTPQAEFIKFFIQNSQSTSTPPHPGEAVRVRSIKVTLTNNNPFDADILPNPTLKQFRLYDLDTGLQIGSTVDRAVPSARMESHILDFIGLDFDLPYGAVRRFKVTARIATLYEEAISGSLRWMGVASRPDVVAVPVEAVGLATGLPATNEGSASGNMTIVYANVLRANIDPAAPVGVIGRGTNKVIAVYDLWRDPYGATPPRTVAGEWLNVNFALRMLAPYTVRVYRDGISPETLLGSEIHPPSWYVDTQFPLPALTISNSREAPTRIFVTLDTVNAENASFEPWLSNITWTDGISVSTFVQDTSLVIGPLSIE